MARKHKHNWSVFTYSGKEVTWRCRCGATSSQAYSKENQEEYERIQEEVEEDSQALHTCWWDFDKKFRTNGQYTSGGYDLMEKVEAWAEAWPQVKLIQVDDEHFSTSTLLVMPCFHKNGALWGTHFVIIPQHGGNPTGFFMYGNNLSQTLEVLKAIAKTPGREPNHTPNFEFQLDPLEQLARVK